MAEDQQYHIPLNNLKTYPLLGKGSYRTVYKINEGICVKVSNSLEKVNTSHAGKINGLYKYGQKQTFLDI